MLSVYPVYVLMFLGKLPHLLRLKHMVAPETILLLGSIDFFVVVQLIKFVPQGPACVDGLHSVRWDYIRCNWLWVEEAREFGGWLVRKCMKEIVSFKGVYWNCGELL